ncbi:MAG TPA: hypothetical protein VNF99_21290 [Stellaceae bacterium]|nr:hypothetical protein [Stellaceae bacterium]
MTDRLWFRAKTYGWGWTPATWEGWAVMGVYVVLVAGWIAYLGARGHLSAGLDRALFIGLPIVVLTACLAVICWLKGERPGWRWGK